MAKIRSCIVDAQEYKYCPNCGDNGNEKWRMIFCSDNCRAIKSVWDEYTAGNKTATEAKSELNNCDMTKIDSFLPYIKPAIDEIMGTTGVTIPVFESEPIIDEEPTVEAEPVVETEVVEAEPEIAEETSAEEVTDTPFYFKKKNKNKRKNIVNDDFTVESSTPDEE